MEKLRIVPYLKQFSMQGITWAVTSGIFLLLGALENLDPAVWRYALLLSGTLLVLSIFTQCSRERRKTEAVTECRLQAPEITAPLPVPSSPSEQQEQQLIAALQQSLFEQESRTKNQQDEMLNYYTMWVHQIKTPIAALDLLIQGSDSEASSDMDLELRRIRQYVEMVLSYQRLGSEQTDFLFQNTDLDRVIRTCIKKQSVFFIRKHLSLDFRPTGRTINTDRKWLSFALEQILSNALKYTREGGGIRIAEAPPEKTLPPADRPAENGFSLVIEDNGIGIREEDLPRIFDRGFTGRNGREHQKATGIGLYLTAETLKRLGCGISAESEPGRGTRIFVYFPESRRGTMLE
ncbi:sensor histidine kinase [Eubacterium pyruvativorans]|uniref:sensor histidine kinase n=1 Tax=Eubacterium pyruvativorans TaxID=155865 RepID=UPI0008884FE0|nr:sensor histidine kinase [Eubacterium pyruvativorans]SDE80957.1 hypothetical protein SAMN04487889_10491 [Eubacterium pyruvativorans]